MPRGNPGRIFVFAKPPAPGTAKTRLAARIGDARAAALARAFLRDTVAAATRPGSELVLATPDPGADHGVAVPAVPQGSGDLGERLERVLSGALADVPWVVALGADSPGLPADRLDTAVASLRAGRAVIGPADDGGFYLLGLPRCPRGLLADLPWSTSETLAATIARLRAHHLDPILLPAWFDVDRAEDLVRFRREVPRPSAPHTWAELDDQDAAPDRPRHQR